MTHPRAAHKAFRITILLPQRTVTVAPGPARMEVGCTMAAAVFLRSPPSFTGPEAPLAERRPAAPLNSRIFRHAEDDDDGDDTVRAAAGLAAIASSMIAGLVIWLLLMRPQNLVDAASGHHVAGLARLVMATFLDILRHLLELL